MYRNRLLITIIIVINYNTGTHSLYTRRDQSFSRTPYSPGSSILNSLELVTMCVQDILLSWLFFFRLKIVCALRTVSLYRLPKL
jgi:hypothetical protein